MRTPQSAQSLPSGQLVASVRGVIELGPPSPQIASFARFIEVESAHVLVQTMEPGAIGGAGGGESAAAPGAVRRRPALSPSSSLLSRHFTPCSESCLLRSSSAPWPLCTLPSSHASVQEVRPWTPVSSERRSSIAVMAARGAVWRKGVGLWHY